MHLVVHAVLRRHLWRLRRARPPALPVYFTDTVSQVTPVMAGYCTAGVCLHRIAGAADRRRGGGQDRRDQDALTARLSCVAAITLVGDQRPHLPRCSSGARRCSSLVIGNARLWQRRGVPARAAALPQRNRRDDGLGRLRRRRSAASTSPSSLGFAKQCDWQPRHSGFLIFAATRARGAGRVDSGQASLADDLVKPRTRAWAAGHADCRTDGSGAI